MRSVERQGLLVAALVMIFDSATQSIYLHTHDTAHYYAGFYSNDTAYVDHWSEKKSKADIAKTIRQQYGRLKDLYAQMKETSPRTKIFVVGYPQFVTDLTSFCSYGTVISTSERKMMIEAVSYLNSVIRAAASAADVTYIDIEDSLYRNTTHVSDHRLCGKGESYVTRPDSLGTLAELQELFHPNAKGHFAIYSKINEALGGHKLSDAGVCNETIVCPRGDFGEPELPQFFAPAVSMYQRVIQSVDFFGEGVRKLSNGVSIVLEKTS